MASFDIAYPITIANEGGYISAADAKKQGDKGGETYMGVSRVYNPNWAGWAIIDNYKSTNGIPAYNSYIPDPNGTLSNLVKEIYKSQYWDAIKGDSINNQDIANLTFDMKVNSGGLGVEIAQQSVNKLIAPDSITVDGDVGDTTLGKINSLPADQLYQTMLDTRQNWIDTTGAMEDPQAVSGWLNRLNSFRKSIVEDVSQGISDVSDQYTQETTKFGKNYVNLGIAVIVLTVTVVGTGLLVYYIKTKKNA